MPREHIHLMPPFDIQVGWHSDSTVQIGVEVQGGYSIVTQLYGSPDVRSRIGRGVRTLVADGLTDEELGRKVLDIVEASPWRLPDEPVAETELPGDSEYTGLWAILDRTHCNQLIKAVRRARDSAYGRDE